VRCGAEMAHARATRLPSFPQRLVWRQCCVVLLPLPTMVVLVDLEDDAPSALAPRAPGMLLQSGKPVHHSLARPAESGDGDGVAAADERPNPNLNGFSAALSCYP
jgi:hypothetical protein